MKTKKITLLYLIVLPVIFFGLKCQGSSMIQTIDSLKQVIYHQPDNTSKVDNLNQVARLYFMLSQPDSVLLKSNEALNLAIRINYTRGTGDAYYIMSAAYRSKSELDTSLALSENYLEIYLKLQDSLRLAKGYYNLGMLHQDFGNYELALHYCQKSLSYALPLNESTFILGNYNCMGGIFLNKSLMYDSAAAYYLKALDLIERSSNKAHLPTILNNLGDVYFTNEQYEKAKEYINRSLDININNGNRSMIALNYLHLGRLAGKEMKFVEALDFYNKALDIYIELDEQRGIADIYNNIGDIYFWQKKYDLALQYFDKALEMYREMNFKKGIILTSLNKAAAYSEQGKIAEAKALQDSCIALAESADNTDLLIGAYRNISENYYKSKDFEKAFDLRLIYEKLSDSVYNLNKSRTINELLVKFDKGKADARILELEKENLKKTYQRNAYMFTGLGIVVMALFVVVYFRQKSRHERAITEQKIHQLEEEKKLMAAKLLVEGQEEERKRIATELHDGLGVLLSATKMQFSTIMDKSPENKALIEKASRMLEQASGDVRKISHNMMPGLLTKLGFYEAVEDLFEQIDENTALNAICRITGDHDERLPENKEIMLYRIVQELTNNTLKHAEAKNIKLDISIVPNSLEMAYTDDGKGFDYNSKIENDSLGLKSIQSRVNFLNGFLSVDSKPGQGVRYTFEIPV
ncbi:MAG: tetratricopeptide repeat protein [Bacteroidales bacterium]|nr:tetratricopeptide repeat protein [Bacteroidales bacterium]